ncbi:MAG: acyl carrier protein [Deltaproteobacteria bacterium RIFOXYD12_FULL_50_9]|nr:MAG: acyl carrier protein [Deltaproteobacteria bacterium RIFOXYD12_FULL_50_9]
MSVIRKEIQVKLQEIFVDLFDDDGIVISNDTTAKDIDEWDSLMHITLMVTVEREFGIKFRAEEIGQLKCVGELIDLIVERKG